MSNETILNGRYRLIAQEASGGMAVIYKAVDQSLGRTVALKILRPRLTADPSFIIRFRNEARSVANLRHPNIVSVHDVGTDGQTHYIVMEFIEGQDLKKIIRRDSLLSIDLAIDLAIQICAGIGFGHRAGIVHADVKPQNILLTQDYQVKVTDFGIAQALSDTQPTERQDVVWGSPHYFSPEQARGERPTPASDVYSIGIVIFEMLTGRLPYIGTSQQELAWAHLRDRIPVVTEFNPAIPESLSRIVYKVMSKEPTARYRMADQLGHILTSYRDRVISSSSSQHSVSSLSIPPPPVSPTSNPSFTSLPSSPKPPSEVQTPPDLQAAPENDTCRPAENFSVFTKLKQLITPNSKATLLHNKIEQMDAPVKEGQSNSNVGFVYAKEPSPSITSTQPTIHEVFISYSNADQEIMRRVHDSLRQRGLRVWMDKIGLQPGEPSWKRAIQYAIESTMCVVVLLSPEAKQSKWVEQELDYSEAMGKPIYPIMVRGDRRTSVPFGFTNSQWLDIRDENLYETVLDTLAQSIGQRLNVATALQKAKALSFQAYFPKELVVNEWHKMSVYIFEAAASQIVAADVRLQGYEVVPLVRQSIDGVNPRGIILELEAPRMIGLQITPHQIIFGFYKGWHRVDFDLGVRRPNIAQVQGTLTFTVYGQAVAAIPMSFDVVDSDLETTGMISVTRHSFDAIFACYSPADKHIVKRISVAYSVMGTDFIDDMTTVRMSIQLEDIQKVEDIIRSADVFQLFWSSAAARSPSIEKEWRYALRLIDEGIKGLDFIRPVYWEHSIPPIPFELQHLNFIYRPELAE